jgi:hypothetical protein
MFEIALQLPTGLDAGTLTAGEKVAEQIGASEWLGPLAPVALSPFFGLATLSGIATYGPDWLQQRSALFGEASALNSPALFWTLTALAIVTSLPRLSKVSKPLALAAEHLETYSAVIILFVVRMLGSSSVGLTNGPPEQAMLSAGIATLPLDLVMSIVAGLNVVVINAVKLFCEFLIWLVPVPFVDAAIEVGNKTLCAGLMSVYCYSPALAAGLDLLLLVVCALVFGWIYRRVRYYREMTAAPILAWLLPNWFAQRGKTFVAFVDEASAGLPRCAMVTVHEISADEFEIVGRRWWRRHSRRMSACWVAREEGIVIQILVLKSGAGETLRLAHRRWVANDDLYKSTQPSLVIG